jgi:basic membrane protein A
MKRVIVATIATLAVFSMAFVSCTQKKPAVAPAPTFRVGLVTDIGGIDDKSFNQGTWEGIVRFAKEVGLKERDDYKYLQSAAEADYIPNLSTFSDEKLDLIAAPGFLFEKSMSEVADKYPNNKYLIIDSVVNKPNVASAVFAEHEGSFLVGVAAGLKAKADGKKIVGFLGGMQFPLIEKFQAGFEQGVKAVYPECKILVDYAGDFGAPDKGQAIAQKQFNAGAYIIFHAAGGTGNGMIKEAKERTAKGDIRWAIGVDKDQYNDGIYDEANKKSAVLTSMMKRVDVAAHDVAKMTLEGKFPGGQTLVFSVANKGVGIPETNPNLSDDIVAKVKEYEAKIASGELKVSETPAK